MIKGVAIGDVHFCEKPPVCRKDKDFRATQIGKMQQIVKICNQRNAPLFIAGDLYDKWRIGFSLVTEVNSFLLGDLYHGALIIGGNHDLPYHNIKYYEDSPLSVTVSPPLTRALTNRGRVELVHYNEPVSEYPYQVLLEHRMCYLSNPIKGYEGSGYDVKELINTPPYGNKRLIITGDNHTPFLYRNHDGRVWLNTGPIMRTSVTYKYCEPSAWYFEVDDNEVRVERIKLEVDTDAVDRTEMYVEQLKEAEVFQFAEEVTKQEISGINFSANVDKLVADATEDVRTAVYKSIEEAANE